MPDFLLLTSGDHLELAGGGFVLLAVQPELYARKVVPLTEEVHNQGVNPAVEALSVSVSLVDAEGVLQEPAAVTCFVYSLGGELVRSFAGTVGGSAVSFTILTSDFGENDTVLVNFTIGAKTYPESTYLHVLRP